MAKHITPTPAAMSPYVTATIARLGLPAATPILVGAARDWQTAGQDTLALAILGALADAEWLAACATLR